MNILLVQMDVRYLDPEANMRHAEELVADRKADLIVLPEMFTTGFTMEPSKYAEEFDTRTLAWMRSLAASKQAAVAASISTVEDGRYYNRFHFVKPDGSCTIYDKRHLFSFSGENKNYQAGAERVIVDYLGFRILLQICYDLRFPVFSRNTGDYDMAIYIANWAGNRIAAWDTLLKARAIENQAYVVGVNRVGTEEGVNYTGHSAIIDPRGVVLTCCELDCEALLEGSVTLASVNELCNTFPALADADQFKLHI